MIPTQSVLSKAIQQANENLKEYTVEVAKEGADQRQPVFLQLRLADGETQKIGVIHLMHLTLDADKQPFEAIAKNTSEVAQAIMTRINLFFSAKERELYIDENGTIFDFNNCNVQLDRDTFSVDNTVVTLGGKTLALSRIKSEGIVTFQKLDNEHIQLVDEIDQRKGSGIFIDKLGAIYRA